MTAPEAVSVVVGALWLAAAAPVMVMLSRAVPLRHHTSHRAHRRHRQDEQGRRPQ